MNEERPYIDAFDYIEHLGEKVEDRKLIKINRFLQEDRKKKGKEIERLNNIIKELEKWLENEIKFQEIFDNDFLLRKTMIKLQELKGSDKE